MFCKTINILIFVFMISALCQGQTVTARWSMDWTGLFNPTVRDKAFALGEGVIGGAGGHIVELDHLWYFGDTGYTPASEAPPETLFAEGFYGTDNSYNAGAQSGDGALFFPADQYGNEFDYNGSFTIEGFFRTHGDQSQNGLQQLILQAENDYSYSIVLNEGGAGKLSFGVNVTTDGTTIIQADDRNYADGNWYYFAARYNDSDDTISLDVLSADGSLENNEISLTSGAELVTGGDGNMFIGRETYQGGRQFYGLINEIRISSGVLDNSELMGDLPLESEPYPSPRADNIELNPRLSWKHNPDAVAYNVYFGQDEPLDYVGRLEHNYYEPDQLNPGDTYLWRIDEITEGDTVNTGKLWYFTTKAPNCDGPIPNDYNKDCAVNFKDLKHFVRYWLHCGIVPQSACFD